MKIGRDTFVTLQYRVTDKDGNLVDPGLEPLQYVHGGYGDIFGKIEQALEGQEPGQSISIALEPAESFGEYDPALVEIGTPDQFRKSPEIGDQIERDGSDNLYRVTGIEGDKVILDANHPLAGLSIVFFATVADVRKATPGEIARVDSGRLRAGVKSWKAVKLALSYLLLAPLGVLLVAGPLLEMIESKILDLTVAAVAVLLILVALWNGIKQLRDVFRGGDALRLDRDGLFWHAHGPASVPWNQIARVELSTNDSDPWFAVELEDKTSFTISVGNLSASVQEIGMSLGMYLPKEKLAGI